MLEQNRQIIQDSINKCSEPRKALLEEFLGKIETHYFEAPASSSKAYHDAIPGGLAKHSVKVLQHLEVISVAYRTPTTPSAIGGPLSMDSLVTVALLHDCHKACDASGTPYYVPNELKSGKISTDKPYKVNPDYLRVAPEALPADLPPALLQRLGVFAAEKYPAGGTSSLELIKVLCPELYAHLTPAEVQAIRWHDGGYGEAKYVGNGQENLLTILLHAADMIDSRWEKFMGGPVESPEKTE
jgi:hypothetical protein